MSLYDYEANESIKIGTHYNWPYAGSSTPLAVTGYEYSAPLLELDRAMPINGLHRKDEDGVYREGGPWMIRKRVIRRDLQGSGTYYRYNRDRKMYTGSFYLNQHAKYSHTTPVSEELLESRRKALENRGADFWNKLRPDAPDFSLSASIYELRELPMMFKDALSTICNRVTKYKFVRNRRKKKWYSHAGDYYLAIEFGYLPLYRDIVDFIKYHRQSTDRLNQLIRDAGKPVRRSTLPKDKRLLQREGKDFRDEKLFDTFKKGYDGSSEVYLRPAFVTQAHWFSNQMGVTTKYGQRHETWAEGQFRYILPPGPRNYAWNRKMYRRIMGMRLSPAQLYQVIPWSWFIDYFVNLGSFIESISPGVSDNLICDYAYIMESREIFLDSEGTMGVRTSPHGGYKTITATRSDSSISKIRVKASPFGFGIKRENLTLKQSAILVALGLQMS